MKYTLESVDNYEFEFGTFIVINQLEVCTSQMSVNQVAYFTTDIPSGHLILAAVGEFVKGNCFIEYTVKLLQITVPLEDRLEQASLVLHFQNRGLNLLFYMSSPMLLAR